MKFDRASEESVECLVRAFYAKVRCDPFLEPVFTDAIGRDWEAHLSRMRAFWGSAMRVSGPYRGDMLVAHRRIPQLRPALFERWLELFEATVEEHFAAEAAAAFRERARKIARNLQLALFHRPYESCGDAAPGGGSVSAGAVNLTRAGKAGA